MFEAIIVVIIVSNEAISYILSWLQLNKSIFQINFFDTFLFAIYFI